MANLVFAQPALGTVLSLPGLPGGSNKIHDRSPYGYGATITGASWKRLFSGLWYLDYDGIDDRVVVGTKADWKWMHGAEDTAAFKWTIKLWTAKTNPEPDDLEWFLSTYSGASAYVGFGVVFDDRSSVPRSRRLLVSITAGAEQIVVNLDAGDNSYPNDTAWHHIVATHDQALSANNCSLYLDTDLIKQADKTGVTPSTADPKYNLQIGNSEAGNYAHNGGITLLEIKKNIVWTQLDVLNSFEREKHLFGVW